jgi:hypothetical protein
MNIDGRAANGRIRLWHLMGESGAIPHTITSKIILLAMSVP